MVNYEDTFTVLPEHLLLMRRAYVDWDDCEYGAPAIDCKRPYGNSDVIQDIMEIIGLEEVKDGIYRFKLFGEEYLLKGEDMYNIDMEKENELVEKLDRLHRDTEKVLQIALATGQFKAGKYGTKSKYDGTTWVFIE